MSADEQKRPRKASWRRSLDLSPAIILRCVLGPFLLATMYLLVWWVWIQPGCCDFRPITHLSVDGR